MSGQGACHCGQITWQVKLPQGDGYTLCHCNTCKTLSGGASTLNSIIPMDDLKITSGSLKCYDYQGDSGKPVHCYYCPNCTTHVYHHQTALGSDKIVYRSGILPKGPSKSLKADAEIYWKDAYPIEVPLVDKSKVFDVLPPGM